MDHWRFGTDRVVSCPLEAYMATELTQDQQLLQGVGSDYKYGFHDKENYAFKSGKGLTREIVTEISRMKNEPEWMLKSRLRALDIFHKKPMPRWANSELLDAIDFANIHYYVRATEKQG